MPHKSQRAMSQQCKTPEVYRGIVAGLPQENNERPTFRHRMLQGFKNPAPDKG